MRKLMYSLSLKDRCKQTVLVVSLKLRSIGLFIDLLNGQRPAALAASATSFAAFAIVAI